MNQPAQELHLAHVEARDVCRFDVGHVHADDQGAARPAVTEADDGVDRAWLSFEHGFDRSVRQVAHPARDAVGPRDARDGVAEADALHAAVDDYSLRHGP
jgi:hypothetical protein